MIQAVVMKPLGTQPGIFSLGALIAITCLFAARVYAEPASPGMRLYAVDCGQIDYSDMDGYSDTDDYAGQAGSLVVPCFLVLHGGEWLLWDSGVGDRIAALPNGEIKQNGRFSLRRTLVSQLAQIGLAPADIKYIGLSHLHSDHSGNINLFPHAVFLVTAAELVWARGLPTPAGVEALLIAPLERAQVVALDGDRDVFGDGTVRILKALGHTRGHCMLLVKLPNSGPILITGDLFHQRRSLREQLVPRINVSRADTLASMDRFKGLANTTGARVIIPHERRDFEALPAFPKFLN